jgi:hypothetical protein
MLLYTIQIFIFCVVFIYLIDYLFHFFKNNLTVPKTKDFIHLTPKKYEDILKVINKTNQENTTNIQDLENKNIIIEEIEEKKDTMKNELKNFLKKQLNANEKDAFSNSNISNYDNNTNNFSLF